MTGRTTGAILRAVTLVASCLLVVGGCATSGGTEDLRDPAMLVDVKFQNVFPIQWQNYIDNPVGSVQIRNAGRSAMREVQISLLSTEFMYMPTEAAPIREIPAGDTCTVGLNALFNNRILDITAPRMAPFELSIRYKAGAESLVHARRVEVQILSRNAVALDDYRRLGSFITPVDAPIRAFGAHVASVIARANIPGVDRNLQKAIGLFEAIRIYGVRYIQDPAGSPRSSGADGVSLVRFPMETLIAQAGSTADLAVLYCSLLEGLRVPTALFRTGDGPMVALCLEGGMQAALQESPAKGLVFEVDSAAWVAVDLRRIRDGFHRSLVAGASLRRELSATGPVDLCPAAESWGTYPPVLVRSMEQRVDFPSELVLYQAFTSQMSTIRP